MSATATTSEPQVPLDEFRPGGWKPQYVWMMLVCMFISEFGVLVSLYPVNALTQIGTEFGTDQVAWVASIITLGGVLGPMSGKLADRYGKKRILLGVLALAVVGLFICAFAPNFPILIIGRIIQAPMLAVGFLIPSLIRDIFPTKLIPFATMVGITGASLITVGAQLFVGSILESFGFRGTFWIPAIVGAVVIVCVMLSLPESGVRDRSGRMDVLGALLLGGGFGLILLGVSLGPSWGWTSLGVIGVFALGIVSLVSWMLQARRTPEPIVDLRELANVSIIMTLIIAGIVAALSGWFYALLPIITLQPAGSGWGLGLDPTQHGYIAAIWSLGGACGGLVGGFLMGRFAGPKVLFAGVALMVIAYVIATFGQQQSPMITIAAFSTGAAGAGSVAACMYLMMRQVPVQKQATMSSIVTLAYGLTSASVPVILFAVMNALGTRDAATGTVAYSAASITAALVIPACIAALGVLCALVLWAKLPRYAAASPRTLEREKQVSRVSAV